MSIPKKYTPFILIALVFVVLAIAACLYGLAQVSDFVWDSNAPKPPVATDFQKYIDDIMADPKVDISGWPTFANTKYGWSIKYHPDVKYWNAGPGENPKDAGMTGYFIDNYDFGIQIYKNEDKKSLFEVAKLPLTKDQVDNLADVQINQNIFLADWRYLNFFITNNKNKQVAYIFVDSLAPDYLKEQLIKSISTFQFLK
jgi:hypothetical protein